MRGLCAIVEGCEVLERSSFEGDKGPVYQMEIGGFAFVHRFTTGNREEADAWPAEGAIGDVVMRLSKAKDGNFKLGNPTFRVKRQPAESK